VKDCFAHVLWFVFGVGYTGSCKSVAERVKVGSEVNVFGEGRAIFYARVHGAIEWACEYFEGCVEACVYCRGEAVCDCPLIGCFGSCALWVQPLCAWMVSLHEVCEVRYKVG
jgi:hypothetical protein